MKKKSHIYVTGIYGWVQFNVDPNKNLDLADFNMFYLILD